jgi:hypothetical protein
MIDLNALDNDPWSTFPTKKDDLRALAEALKEMEKELSHISAIARHYHQSLVLISRQSEEQWSRGVAERALGPVKGGWGGSHSVSPYPASSGASGGAYSVSNGGSPPFDNGGGFTPTTWIRVTKEGL